jgi:hypothetical protein
VPGKIGTAQNLQRDIFRGILEPMFGGIDRNNANWCDVLFGHQISDSGFDIPLSEDAPIVTEAINDKIHFMIVTCLMIVTCRLDRPVPAPTHPNS